MQKLFYRMLRVVNRVELLTRERLTPAGWVVLATGGGAAIAGVDTNQTMNYRAVTLLPRCLRCIRRRPVFRARAHVVRSLPHYATAGARELSRPRSPISGTRTAVGARWRGFRRPAPGYAEFARRASPARRAQLGVPALATSAGAG